MQRKSYGLQLNKARTCIFGNMPTRKNRSSRKNVQPASFTHEAPTPFEFSTSKSVKICIERGFNDAFLPSCVGEPLWSKIFIVTATGFELGLSICIVVRVLLARTLEVLSP